MKNRFTSLLALATVLCLSGQTPTQAQTLDPAFQPTVLKSQFTNPNIQNSPQIVAVQPDGKVLVGGGFDFMNGTPAGKIQRLNPDGTTDPSFNAGGSGANGFLAALLVQPDGKILVGGGLTAYNGAPSLTVARLNANGTLDASFSPVGLVALRQIGTLALQPDGKILVGGGASLQGGAPNPGVTRLNANGTLDASFNVGAGVTSVNGFVRGLLVQADGKILVGGTFTSFNGQPVGNLVRLNSDGTVDAGFAIGTGATATAPAVATVRAFAQQADGRILVGGNFTEVNGQPASRLARLLPNGTLDAAYNVGTGPNNTVLSILIQTNGGAQFNGSAVISGSFTQVNGQARGRVARVFDNGTLDASFGTTVGAGTSMVSTVASVAQLGTGQFVAAGNFTQYDGVAKTGVVRLTATGANDPVFTAVAEARGTISLAVPLANGQTLISGTFSEFNGTPVTGGTTVRRLNANGSLDQTYSTTYSGLIATQPDGTFYSLTTVGTQFQLVRTLASGAVDNAYTSLPFGATNTVGLAPFQGAVAQSDGKLLVFGNFPSYGGVARNGIARLNANGTLDNTFTPPTSTIARVIVSAVVQPSGKIVVIYQESGTGAAIGTFIVRLNADGTLDNTFNTGTGAGPNMFFSQLQQPDGKLLLSGGFTSFNGQPTPFGTVRLGVDGAVDNSFNGLMNGYALRLVQPDGRILAITGLYGTNAIVRLNTNGSPDNTFAPVVVPAAFFIGEDLFGGLALQPVDNKILVYGSFRSVAGQLRIGLARLLNPVASATQAAATALPLHVYPNPTTGPLRVDVPAGFGLRELQVLNATGQLVLRQAASGQQVATVLTGLAPGWYTVRAVGTSSVLTRTLVVE